MEFKLVDDKEQARIIFSEAFASNDTNSKNYSPEQFEKSWNKWLKFYVLFDGDDPVAFSGIRDFGDYARIFDRYFVSRRYRQNGLTNNEFCKMIVPVLVDQTEGRVPFFSMEFLKRRPVIQDAIRACNEVLPEDKRFHLLPGLYETMPNSWQNIAIQVPHTSISLNMRSLDEFS